VKEKVKKRNKHCKNCKFWGYDDPAKFYVNPELGFCNYLPDRQITGEYEWCHQFVCSSEVPWKRA
jgi:hypothetical protein